MRFWDLGNKDVINCKTGRKIGCVGDLEIDLCNFCITDLYVPVGSKFCGCIGKKQEYRIPVKAVVRVGVDIILVDIDEKKCLFQ
ncbi:MAG: YlmC/YmxH family sporulation protein [Lachnospiraceae bacterium]|nr:YlmC/YmxH family sporulation protein [Lachnospiraceae bacterium]MDY5497047.1 YlmC/YmxH family sporulation protein [Anaerobutyricum sp.]